MFPSPLSNYLALLGNGKTHRHNKFSNTSLVLPEPYYLLSHYKLELPPPPPPLFNIITIQDKGSHYNVYLLSDAIFVLGVVTVWFNFSRGDHFAVGLAVDDVKSFLIHVDEYKSNFCS